MVFDETVHKIRRVLPLRDVEIRSEDLDISVLMASHQIREEAWPAIQCARLVISPTLIICISSQMHSQALLDTYFYIRLLIRSFGRGHRTDRKNPQYNADGKRLTPYNGLRTFKRMTITGEKPMSRTIVYPLSPTSDR
jgi:hypothetical protein